jgi:hypothetical protein
VALPGYTGAWALVQIPVSQLSTAETNQINISIGAGGTGGIYNPQTAAGRGGNTTIDTDVVICQGGSGSLIGQQNPSSTVTLLCPSMIANSLTVTSPSLILKSKNLDGIDFMKFGIRVGWINASAAFVAAAALNGISAYGRTFFSHSNFGCGGDGEMIVASHANVNGNPGQSGAVILWMYS